ncbi:MAG: phosphotransferase [Alphaproteobacteria bacterium]|nr:phosphotransferase [Alphaproteobacteria bacterium]
MADRQALIESFLGQEGWGNARRTALTGDASFRRYHRLDENGRYAMLMDAPPPQEDIGPFLAIARHLTGLGYSAPQILAEDHEAGFILLEDFGDSTFTRLLAAGEDETALYLLATDVLIDLHKKPAAKAIPENLPQYDSGKLLTESALLTDWFVPAATGKELSGPAAEEYQNRWRDALARSTGVPDSLVLRDYHVDNLMRLDGRDGIAACGLLDFQDALVGPVTYDLVSLIEDARRDVSPETAAAVTARYLAAFPDLDPDDFTSSMTVFGAQRHAKVIGIFTRLCVRDGKPIYLDHIPRVWRLLETACQHPDLAPIREWLDDHIPVGLRCIPEGLRTS